MDAFLLGHGVLKVVNLDGTNFWTGEFRMNLHLFQPLTDSVGDVANSKRPVVIIPKMQLRLRVTRRSATALVCYPQKLAKIVCG